MPSGAKKRKAAKKKKEQETNNSTNNNPQGENELKSIDENDKGSDGGEGGSPAHDDHDDHHQFNEVNDVVEVSEPSIAVAKFLEEVPNEDHQFNEVREPSASVAKSLEEVPKIDRAEGGKEGVVVIEWDVKSEESCESNDVSAVHIESAKESNYQNGKSDGSNNETATVKNLKDEPNNSVKEAVAVGDLVNSVAGSSAEFAKESNYRNGKSSGSTNETITVKNLKDEPNNSVNETVAVDELVNSVKKTVNSVAGSSAESAKESNYGNGKSSGSTNETVTVKNLKDEPNNSVNETVAVDELVNSVKKTVNSVAGSSADLVKAVTFVPEVKNGDTENVLLGKSVDSQVMPTDLTVKRNEDKVHPFSDEDVRTSSLEETKTKELDTKASSSVSHCHIPESTNSAEHVKDSDSPECSENQPLLASAPQTVHKTPWWSCCGLFEVLSDSNT